MDGHLQKGSYTVELTGDDLGIQGSFPTFGKVVKVKDADPANVIGSITVTEKNRSVQYPAIVKAQYGSGKALFFAFDLGLNSENAIVFPALLKHTLQYIHRPISNPEGLPYSFYPNQLVPMEITLKSLGAAFDLKLTETYPAGIKLYDPATKAWIADNPWMMNIRLEPDETKVILYYALTPDTAGTYTFQTEVGYLENGTYTPYQTLNTDITIAKDSATMTDGLLAALDALTVTGKDRKKLDHAGKYVRKVRDRTASSEEDIEKNIHDLLKAVKSLFEVTADASGVRLMIDGLLEFWETRWYYWHKEL